MRHLKVSRKVEKQFPDFANSEHRPSYFLPFFSFSQFLSSDVQHEHTTNEMC